MTPSEYVKEHLERNEKRSSVNRPYGRYRGYETGSLVYGRRDGQPITEEDISMLNQRKLGQSTYVVGKPGDQEVTVKYTCDSTD